MSSRHPQPFSAPNTRSNALKRTHSTTVGHTTARESLTLDVPPDGPEVNLPDLVGPTSSQTPESCSLENMGQSASSQREEFNRRDSRRFSQLVQNRDNRHEPISGGQGGPTYRELFPGPALVRRSGSPTESMLESQPPFATFRRQVSAQSIPVQADDSTNGEVQRGDEVLFEEPERPLVNMEDLRMRDAPITHITASPMPRRQSVISRLSSRLLPRYASSASATSSVDPLDNDRALRRRLSDRLEPAPEDGVTRPSSNRFSTIGSLRSRYTSSPRQRRRRDLAPVISPPLPISTDRSLSPHGIASSSMPSLDPVEPMTSASGPSTSGNSLPFLRRTSRLSRVRNSFSMPLPRLFSQPSPQTSETQYPETPPRRPSRVAFAEDADYLLPPLSTADASIDIEDPSLDSSWFSTNPRADNSRAAVSPPQTSTTRRRTRSINNILRGESRGLGRRDIQAPLSQVLQLAAAAIAAQLSGTPTQPITNMQAVGSDGLDGSLDNFFQTLQQAASVGNNGSGPESGDNASQTDGSLPPVNFLRVFRFVNSNEHSRQTSGTSTPNVARAQQQDMGESQEGSATDGDDASDGRTVTLVVVGVRSVPANGTNVNEDLGAVAGPSLDALLSLPIVPTTNILRAGAGGLLRRADGRSRFSHRRRASMGGLNSFPAGYDSQRHQRTQGPSRSQSGEATPVTGSSLPTVLSESPPGPHPPPSTPADPSMSAYSSGSTTPSRRPSSASAISPPGAPVRRESFARRSIGAGLEPTAEDAAFQSARQRRRSDSEFARHRDLGSGAARRNGVVGPDDAPAQGGRSWLIYVVGTNLSEDHPAFATPSLFTDSPTYEDMLLLSSLLGPAKPPVASREDVASAPGVFRIQGTSEALVAEDSNGARIQIGSAERCLVCLCDYELKEELRQLAKCGHLYHRECIDEWLTTGRNSCPLCRGQGVDEKTEPHIDPSPTTMPQAL